MLGVITFKVIMVTVIFWITGTLQRPLTDLTIPRCALCAQQLKHALYNKNRHVFIRYDLLNDQF